MTDVVVDFESFYSHDISVSLQGNLNYFRDSDAYILALTVGTEVLCGTLEEMRETCDNMATDPTLKFWAANSNFDEGWWNKYYPPAASGHWSCILDVGRFNQFPGNLAGLSKVGLGKEMDKTTRDEMKGKRYEDLSPERQIEVQEYCLTDVVRSYELLQALPPMSATEEKIAAHTRLINRRGVNINRDLVESDKTKMETMRFEAFKAIPWHRDEAPLSYKALRDYCAARGIPVPKSTAKTDEECNDLMSSNPELEKVLGTMRRFRKANTLLKKVDTLLARTTEGDILPLDIIYCGAPHTRRWSSKGFNIQNLDKKPLQVTQDLTVWTRNWIIPPPGCEFLILDFAQVEPRCLNWLAGNEDMMKALRLGFSYYEAYARFARNWSGAPGSIKKEYGVQKYTLLKNECLGLGYGMGVDRFIDYAAENGNTITAKEAKPVVDGFRKNNPKIVSFWRKLDNLIISAARDKGRHLGIELPTGDLLQYFAVRPKPKRGYEGFTVRGDFSQNSKQINLWGGTLTENVTQRMARDVLAEAILRLESSGFPVAFHAHDEVILVVPLETDEKKREEVKKEAERITAQAPEWAPDLPLGVEGDYATCYTKF